MNKAILLSIRAEHVKDILNGDKTLELRKTVPKDFKGWVYIYCTKDKKDILWSHKDGYYHIYILNGKVVARFWFDEYAELNPNNVFWENVVYYEQYDNRYPDEDIEQSGVIDVKFLEELTQVSLEDIQKYSKSKYIYGWHIKKLEIFNKPMELKDFGVKRAPQSYQYVYTKELENDK